MKKLLLFLFISVIIKANCQVIQKITGSTVDVTAQYIQFQKTNDSLKVVLTMAKVAIVKYKQDSASFKAWQGDKNAQVRLKMDSISNLKKVVKVKSDSILLLKTNLLNCSNQSKAVIKMNDSLKLVNYDVQYQYIKYKAQQFSDTIEFIGFTDTVAGVFTKITEKQYAITPKFTWQILKRYPINTALGIKTKEVTITELKQ